MSEKEALQLLIDAGPHAQGMFDQWIRLQYFREFLPVFIIPCIGLGIYLFIKWVSKESNK